MLTVLEHAPHVRFSHVMRMLSRFYHVLPRMWPSVRARLRRKRLVARAGCMRRHCARADEHDRPMPASRGPERPSVARHAPVARACWVSAARRQAGAVGARHLHAGTVSQWRPLRTFCSCIMVHFHVW